MHTTHDFPSWMTGPLIGFDTETTGVDPLCDRLVTAAIVSRSAQNPDGTRSQEIRTWLADPGVDIPEAAASIHGISTEVARAQGRPIHEVLEEVTGVLAAAMSQEIPIVAFNGCFDFTLLESELARHGLATLTQRLGRPLGPIIDPLVLDRAVDRYRKGKRQLGLMAKVYGVDMPDTLHQADNDVVLTLDVLQALVHVYPDLAQMSASSLHDFQCRAYREWAQNFNAYLARMGREADVDPGWPLSSRYMADSTSFPHTP